MPIGNGQDEFEAGALGARFGLDPSLLGRSKSLEDIDSPTPLRVSSDWRKVREFSSGSFASTTRVRSHVEANELLAFLREALLARSETPQFRGEGPEKAITLGVGSAERSPYRGRVTGPVKFINQLLDTWHLSADSACTLLGFEHSDAGYIQDVLRGYATLRGRDAKDRIAHLFQIRASLSALFQDESVENEWLRERQQILNDKTPMELLQEGSMENLLLVKEYVGLVAGR